MKICKVSYPDCQLTKLQVSIKIHNIKYLIFDI